MERATLETVRQHITAEYEIVTEATARLRLPTEIKFKLCLVTIKLFSPGLPIAKLESQISHRCPGDEREKV